MCRFLLYRGSDDILLSKLILDPTHSILRQSIQCRLRLDTRRGANNADGFGIGWYTDPKLGAEPCLFKSTTPAWNCSNLPRIASKTASKLVFAHVRATTEGTLSEDNCHPFCHGSLMWMHNGGLGGWKYIKRRLGEQLHDKWYLSVSGGTDSEWAFALFLDRLERLGVDPSSQPAKGFGPALLRKAMLQTIEVINELTSNIPESIVQGENVDTRSLLNFAVTDGHSIICTRYINSRTDEAASLYFSSGTQWDLKASNAANEKDYQMERRDKGADIVLVASEPLTFEREKWVNVPTNSILTIHGQTVMINPIDDSYTERDPYHKRSSAFVHTKGLITNEKANRMQTDTPPSGPADMENQQKLFPAASGVLPNGAMGRSRTPDRAAAAAAVSPPPPPPPHVSSSSAGPTSPVLLPLRSRPDNQNRGGSGPGAASAAATQSPPAAAAAAAAPTTTGPPSQGNIKKKRRSLNVGEWPHPADYHHGGQPGAGGDYPSAGAGASDDAIFQQHRPDDSPVHSPTRSSDYMTSEKAARVLGMSV